MNVKISIITVSLDAVRTIEQTIQSVINQSYKDIEYIIIDGGSTDGTVDIIKKYESKINHWISEPDAGISDAFNKGVKLAKGDYINFQGADDYLWDNDVIEKIVDGIRPKKDELVCGRIARIEEVHSDKVLWVSSGKKFRKSDLLFHMALPHQALFMHKRFFEKYGLFDVNLVYSMDYELLLRAYKNFPDVIMKDIMVSAWRAGGIGQGKTLKIFAEYDIIKRKNKVTANWLLYLINCWILFKFYGKFLLVKLFNSK